MIYFRFLYRHTKEIESTFVKNDRSISESIELKCTRTNHKVFALIATICFMEWSDEPMFSH